MFTSLNNIIIMTRGDSLEFKPTRHVLGRYNNYELKDGDALYFGLMYPGQRFEDAIIRKMFTANEVNSLTDFVIELKPEDTVDLVPGKYFYALKLQLNHEEYSPELGTVEVDKVITLINKTKFIIND